MLFLADRLWDVFSSDIYTWPVEVLHSRADSEINDGQSGVSRNIRKRCKFQPNQAKGEEVRLVEDYLSYFRHYICQMATVSLLQTHRIPCNQLLQASWLLCVPPVLTFQNSTFCAQCICMFLCISELQRIVPYTAFSNWFL